jgi:hypothetical protein
MALPDHLFVGCEGALYDTRNREWAKNPPLRANYRYTRRKIRSVADLKACLRNGRYAWPGGYPMFFLTSDGATLSFEAVRAEFHNVANAIKHKLNDGWRVVGCEINYEDDDLWCAHTNERIESAYAED